MTEELEEEQALPLIPLQEKNYLEFNDWHVQTFNDKMKH